jgi:gliding motility-associated-like protein
VVCDPRGTVDLTDYIEGFNPTVYDYTVLSPSGVSMQISDLEKVSLSGDYRVSSAIKGSGCWNQSLRIRVLITEELLEAEFNYEVDLGNGTILPNAEAQIQENIQFYDFSIGKAIIWNWDFGDGNTSTSQNPTHQYQNKGTYTVSLQVIDSIGCVSTYERVIVVTDDYRIMVPNAFTPDGSKNQNFKPYTRGIASMEFYVFNTWGELLYKSESLEDQGWNGLHNGKPAPNGNYVYRGRFTSRSGEVSEKSGVFLLIR